MNKNNLFSLSHHQICVFIQLESAIIYLYKESFYINDKLYYQYIVIVRKIYVYICKYYLRYEQYNWNTIKMYTINN